MVFGLVGDGKAVEHRRCTGKAGQSQYDFEGRNVPEIVFLVIVNRCTNYVRQPDQKEGVRIDWYPRKRLGRRIAPLAKAVLDDKLLSHMFS